MSTTEAKVKIIGKVALRTLMKKLAPILEDDPFPGCFWILSGFTVGQIAEFVNASASETNLVDKLHIELPRGTFQGVVPDSLLVDHSAVHTRSLERAGRIIVTVDSEGDVGTSLNHKDTIAADALKASDETSDDWYAVVSKELGATISETTQRQIIAMIRGIFDAGYFGIEAAADYILSVVSTVSEGSHLVKAAGINLPKLGLPMYEDCFKMLVDKKLGYKSQWSDKFEQHQRNASYIARRHPTGELLDPDDLLKALEKQRDKMVDGNQDVPEGLLHAFAVYANAEPSDHAPAPALFFAHDWRDVKKLFEKTSSKSSIAKFVDETRKALKFKNITLSSEDSALLDELETKTSRKSNASTEPEKHFFEQYEGAIAEHNPKLAAEWQDYVYEKRASCSDLIEGLFDCLRRRLQGFTVGSQCKIVVEGVQQHSIADFKWLDPDVCSYFERHYGKLSELTKGLVSFAGEGTGKKRTLLPVYSANVQKELEESRAKRGSKLKKTLEFRVVIHEKEPGQNDWLAIASIPLKWQFPGDSVPMYELADLNAIIKHASKKTKTALAKGIANYASVGKNGLAPSITLENTQGFDPSPGDNIAGRFIPSPSRVQTVDSAIIAILEEAVGEGRISEDVAAGIRVALTKLSESAKAAITAYSRSALDIDEIPACSASYREVHELISFVKHDHLRKRLLQELWEFGTVAVEEANRRPTLSIICPWHPLRMEAHRARILQLAERLTQVLNPTPQQFSDDRKGSLFIKDVKELCDSPLLPDLTLFWNRLDAKLMSLTSHLGNYSIHQEEEQKRIHSEIQSSEEDAKEAAQVILGEVDDYLRLQPHERDSLAILLYNCSSHELPSRLVEELNKRNRDPKREKVNCEILLTNRNERQLQEVYQELVADTSNAKGDERENEFLSRIRINISATGSVGPIRRTKRCKPTDIAFCRDLLSKESKVGWEWVSKEGSIVPASELIPHQWQRTLPFKEGSRIVQMYLTCPAQTESGWSYLHNLGFACDLHVKKGWEANWLVLPVRTLNFDSEEVSRAIRETHNVGVWVINQDELLDRRLLEDQNVKVIRYVQSTSLGRNTVISSTARDTLLVATIKEILRGILSGEPSEDELAKFVRYIMDQANAISGRLILRAARRSNNTKELIGVVLSKYLIESQIAPAGKECWFLLDDYCHWLGKRDGSRLADLLVLSPTKRDGKPHLDIVVSEAKFVSPELVGAKKSESEMQLRDTLVQMARALSVDPRPLDQNLWLARLADMLLSRTVRAAKGHSVIPEQWRALIRNRQCTFSITGYSHVFCHLPDDQVISQHKGVETKVPSVDAHQEVFNFEATRDIIVQMLDKSPEKTRTLRNQLGHPKFTILKAIDLSGGPRCEAGEEQVQATQHTDTKVLMSPASPDYSAQESESPASSDYSAHESESPAPLSTGGSSSCVTLLSGDPIRCFIEKRADLHAAVTKDGQEWLAKTVLNLKSALNRHGMSAKSAEGKPPILTPNAALIRLQGGPDLTLSQIEKRSDELYTTDGLKILSVLPGEKTISISVERPDRQVLYTTSVFAKVLKDAAPSEKVFIGIREEDGEPMYFDPFANPHTLVAGATGSGKSVLVQNMLLYIALTRHPKQSHIYLIDGKSGVDYLPLRHLPHIKVGSGSIIDTKEGSIDVLAGLVQEMERRYQLFKEKEAKNINHYRLKTGDYLPTLWVVHDEFAEWMEDDEYAAAVESSVNRLSIKSRAAGIFMMFCAQRPDNTVMPMQLRSQLGNRLVLKVSDPGTAEIATGEKNTRAEQLLKHGHMLAKVDSNKVYLQVPYVDTDEEMEPLVSLLNRHYATSIQR